MTDGTLTPSQNGQKENRVTRKAVRRALREIGESATLDKLNQELRAQGIGYCGEAMFRANYKNLFGPGRGPDDEDEDGGDGGSDGDGDGDGNSERRLAAVVIKKSPEEPPPPPIDAGNFAEISGNLSTFIRFAAAVDSCGGIEKAVKYLELLKGLGRII